MKTRLAALAFTLLALPAFATNGGEGKEYWTTRYEPAERTTYVQFFSANHQLLHTVKLNRQRLRLDKRTVASLNQQLALFRAGRQTALAGR